MKKPGIKLIKKLIKLFSQFRKTKNTASPRSPSSDLGGGLEILDPKSPKCLKGIFS